MATRKLGTAQRATKTRQELYWEREGREKTHFEKGTYAHRPENVLDHSNQCHEE